MPFMKRIANINFSWKQINLLNFQKKKKLVWMGVKHLKTF